VAGGNLRSRRSESKPSNEREIVRRGSYEDSRARRELPSMVRSGGLSSGGVTGSSRLETVLAPASSITPAATHRENWRNVALITASPLNPVTRTRMTNEPAKLTPLALVIQSVTLITAVKPSIWRLFIVPVPVSAPAVVIVP
jgi:hypothetical protein